MNYTLHQLRIFLAVVRNQSITKASEELFLTQPAVSIQLKKLQEQFEIPLTERMGRQLFVTSFGKEIAKVAGRILEANEEMIATVNQYKGLLTGNIHISVVSTGKYVMPYLLSGFVAKHPQVSVRMDVTNKNKVVEALLENKTDFALVSVLPENISLETINLMGNHLYLIGNYEKASQLKSQKLSAKSIGELPLIFREQGSATRLAMERFISQRNITVQKTLALTSNEAVKQAVNAGLGFSIMPLIGLRNELINKDLQLIPVKGLPIITTWMLVYRQGKGLSPAEQAFLEYLNDNKELLTEKHFAWTKGFIDD